MKAAFRNGLRRWISAIAHLHSLSSPSCPAPPFSKLLPPGTGALRSRTRTRRPAGCLAMDSAAGAPGLGATPAENGTPREEKQPDAPNGVLQPPRRAVQGGTPAPGQPQPGGGGTEVTARGREDGDASSEEPGQGRREEALMAELSELVQEVVKSSSWWERHGVDICIITLSFLLLPAGFLCLRSAHAIPFLAGIVILGVVHHTLTVKGSHLASHNALTESKSWGKVWALFFIELCAAFTAEQATYNHVKMHHGYTNVIGLGDSSTWKLPFLNRYVYMFIAPLAVPVLTPLVALHLLRNVKLKTALRTICFMLLGLYSHYWILLHVSGFRSAWSALLCMLVTRALLAHPYTHVNIFQHIGLPMFAADRKPKRIQLMSLGVLNLPRNALLEWSFGHSLISCHVEHHLFPGLSDNMCLKIKPIVSQYLRKKQLPYNEDSYVSRLRLFLQKYEELMVHAPPITELVGIQ
ncbi:fatty acid desaturase 6 isoform X2 [Dromaius novaehollandiae]|uniref:fatty acid desaturase 6 isoform X2 n=1 Tax=Dromaius novaehollandiae TaxID=8790 RepID=UPI00311ED488